MQINGLKRQSSHDVINAVQQGGCFVVYQYCISIVVLTFRRSSAIQYIGPGQDRIGPGLPYTLISLILGWWGFPFGPIFTIASVWNNSRGGKNVTAGMLNLVSQAARSTQQS